MYFRQQGQMFPSPIERSPFHLTPSRIGFIYLSQSTRAALNGHPPWRNHLHLVRPIRGPRDGQTGGARIASAMRAALASGCDVPCQVLGACWGPPAALLHPDWAMLYVQIDLVMLSIMLLTLGRDWSLQVHLTVPDERPADVAPIVGCPPPHYAPPPPCVCAAERGHGSLCPVPGHHPSSGNIAQMTRHPDVWSGALRFLLSVVRCPIRAHAVTQKPRVPACLRHLLHLGLGLWTPPPALAWSEDPPGGCLWPLTWHCAGARGGRDCRSPGQHPSDDQARIDLP